MKVSIHKRTVEQVAEWLDETGFRVELRVRHDPDDTTSGGMILARRRP
jgi:hypothetical protein